jgi:1-acyl-sn-glycerol-3-phosphate acyltransferase
VAEGTAPPSSVAPWRLTVRYWLARTVVWVLVRLFVRLRVEGLDRLPPGPALLCANHLSWLDPVVLIAALPGRPRLHFFGPREEDMTVGARNRLMVWLGTAVPFRPVRTDLLGTTRRVGAVFAAGRRLAIFGEGRIHAREGELLPLQDGAVYFALRSEVPVVPVAIIGTSWIGLGRTVRVRIGAPIHADGRPTKDLVDAVTARTWCALFELTRDAPERPPPGPVGRWLTERFAEWPEGHRPGRTPGAVGPVAAGEPVVGPHGPCPPSAA